MFDLLQFFELNSVDKLSKGEWNGESNYLWELFPRTCVASRNALLGRQNWASLDSVVKKELLWFDLSILYLIPLKTCYLSNLSKCEFYLILGLITCNSFPLTLYANFWLFTQGKTSSQIYKSVRNLELLWLFYPLTVNRVNRWSSTQFY